MDVVVNHCFVFCGCLSKIRPSKMVGVRLLSLSNPTGSANLRSSVAQLPLQLAGGASQYSSGFISFPTAGVGPSTWPAESKP